MAAASDTQDLNVGRIVAACLRSFPIVFVFAAMTSVGAYVVLQHLPDSYKTTSLVWLGERKTEIITSNSAWSTVGGRAASPEEGRTLAAVFKSVPVLRRVVIELELYKRPEDMRSRLSAFVSGVSGLFGILPSERMAAPAKALSLKRLPSSGASADLSMQVAQLNDLEGTAAQLVDGLRAPEALDLQPLVGPQRADDRRANSGQREFSPAMEAAIRAAVAGLAENLSVDVDVRSEIAAISYAALDPELAANVVNAIPKAFAADRQARLEEGTSGAVEWLSERVKEVRREITETERRIDWVKAEHGLTGAAAESADSNQISRLVEASEAAQSELITARRRFERAKAEIVDNPSDSLVFDSETMRQLHKLRADEIGRRREYVTRVGEDHALVREVDFKIRGLDSDIEAEKRRLLRDFEMEFDRASELAKLSRDRLQDVQRQIASNAERGAEASAVLSNLERELEANKELYKELVSRLQEARQIAQIRSEPISVIQPALAPSSPSIVGRPLLVAATGTFSMMLGFMMVAGFTILDRRITHVDQVRACGLKTIISAPVVGRARPGRDRRRRSPQSAAWRRHLLFEEAIRRLFTATLNAGRNDQARTVLLTSGSQQEGKTTVARALASCASATGTATVMVEADLRRPGRYSDHLASENVGLVGYLEGRAELDDIVVRDEHAGLDVVPVMETVQHSTELLASARMLALLTRLKERYKVIVLDSPPICLTPDPEVLVPHADGVVFVLRHGKSAIDRTKRALELLARAGAGKPLAFVNMTDVKFLDEYYGRGDHTYAATQPKYRPSSIFAWLSGRRGGRRARSTSRRAEPITLANTAFSREQ